MRVELDVIRRRLEITRGVMEGSIEDEKESETIKEFSRIRLGMLNRVFEILDEIEEGER